MILLWGALSFSGLFLWAVARFYGAREARGVRFLIRGALGLSAVALAVTVGLKLRAFWLVGCTREELIPWLGLFALQAGGLLLLALRLWRSTRAIGNLRIVGSIRSVAGHAPVLLSPEVESPFLWSGAGGPKIFVPAALWNGLPQRERALIEAHEEGHARGYDAAFRIFLECLIPLFAFHPVLFLLRRELSLLDEYRADDHALAVSRATPAELVRGLLRWNESSGFAAGGSHPGTSTWPRLGATNHLRQRGERLAGLVFHPHRARHSRSGPVAVATLLWALLFFPPALVESKILDGPRPESLGLRTEARDAFLYVLLNRAGVFTDHQPSRDLCPAMNGVSP